MMGHYYNIEMSGSSPVSNIQPEVLKKSLVASGRMLNSEDLIVSKKLNEGDAGKVFLCTYKGKKVACKQVKGVSAQAPCDGSGCHNDVPGRTISAATGRVYDVAVTDIMREVASLSSLKPHPNIVNFLGLIDGDGMRRPVVVEEYLDGVSLKTFLDGGFSCGDRSPLPNKTVWAWVVQLFRGLDSIHSNEPMVIHRDLKPANIMLTRGLNLLVIADFGAAKRIAKGEKSNIQMQMLGNRMYMAPEVLQTGRGNRSHYNEKCDIYSAGLLSWRIATRQPIVRSPAMHGTFPELGRVKFVSIRPLLSQCWSLDPAARPSAKTVISTLMTLPDKPEVGVAPDGTFICAPPSGGCCTVS
mmetsp:Transcript_29976/g.75871  ORF Transcript_29976/g.75871 Transcript_29976/m.75871 type:complete len:355 (-) Transcript_29976:8-1072(-)